MFWTRRKLEMVSICFKLPKFGPSPTKEPIPRQDTRPRSERTRCSPSPHRRPRTSRRPRPKTWVAWSSSGSRVPEGKEDLGRGSGNKPWRSFVIFGVLKLRVPQNGWIIREHPIKMDDDCGYPYFRKLQFGDMKDGLPGRKICDFRSCSEDMIEKIVWLKPFN